MSFYRYLYVFSIIYIVLTCESKDPLNGITFISKCCPEDKQLTLSLNTCVRYDDDTNITSNASTYPWWIPENVYFLSSKNFEPLFMYSEEATNEASLKFSAHHSKELPCDSPEIVPFQDTVSFLDDGSLLIQTDSSNWTFPVTSYCADRVTFGSRSLGQDHSNVILLCPCQQAVCFRKCCRSGMVVEINGTKEAYCVHSDTPLRNLAGNCFNFCILGNKCLIILIFFYHFIFFRFPVYHVIRNLLTSLLMIRIF